jgi:hypothetical protein
MIELMLIHLNLSKWIKTPDAPICEISASSSDKRSRPYSPEEITRMRAFMKKHNWTAYMQLFYNESPRIWVKSCRGNLVESPSRAWVPDRQPRLF